MKTFVKIFCGFLIIAAAVHALPADRNSKDVEKIGRVELEKDSSSVETDVFPTKPIVPFDGFLSGFNDVFERMRQQMLYLMSHLPNFGMNVPEGGNTTSVTKIIDGHKVVINETVYKSDDNDDAAAVFKVRIVDIVPDYAEGKTENTVPRVEGSIETLDQSQENEIPKNLKTSHAQIKRKVNTKGMHRINSLPNQFKGLETFDYPSINNNYNNLESFDDIDSNGVDEKFNDNVAHDTLESFDEEPNENDPEPFDEEDKILTNKNNVIDLSNDILINKLAEKQGRPMNADAEVFVNRQPPHDLSRDTYVNEIAAQRGVPRNPDAEMIESLRTYEQTRPDMFERVVPFSEIHDLSGDTYVNEIAARRRMPLNPDAEFMSTHPRSRYYYKTHHQS